MHNLKKRHLKEIICVKEIIWLIVVGIMLIHIYYDYKYKTHNLKSRDIKRIIGAIGIVIRFTYRLIKYLFTEEAVGAAAYKEEDEKLKS